MTERCHAVLGPGLRCELRAGHGGRHQVAAEKKSSGPAEQNRERAVDERRETRGASSRWPR